MSALIVGRGRIYAGFTEHQYNLDFLRNRCLPPGEIRSIDKHFLGEKTISQSLLVGEVTHLEQCLSCARIVGQLPSVRLAAAKRGNFPLPIDLYHLLAVQ